ncbi:MAG: DUF3800 domain-containing protein [Deltaproteobacteria bacterium]|nr:DUF3800 domain-containing protein [Deltaproteobacteria bacterium]
MSKTHSRNNSKNYRTIGDNGFSEGSTETFSLAGISIEGQYWKEFYWKILNVRQQIAQKYGLQFHEIKGSDIFSHRGPLFHSLVTSPQDVLWIYEQFIEVICDPKSTLFVISFSKQKFRKGQNQANPKQLIKLFNLQIWTDYLAMYDQHLLEKSHKIGRPETGLIYSDVNPGQEKYIRRIVKHFSTRFDKGAEWSGAGIIEDVVFRNSETSKFIQLADILACSVSKMLHGRKRTDVITIPMRISEKLQDKIYKPSHSL